MWFPPVWVLLSVCFHLSSNFCIRTSPATACSLSASYPDWSSSEFGHCKSSKEKEPAPAYLTLSAQPPAPRGKQQPPALPSIKLPELGHFGFMQPPQHGSAWASSSASASAASRPFYSFMPAGPVRIERPRIGIKADDASDGVDLELKL